MLLHVDMGVQVVKSSVALLTVGPVADIEALNLIEATARSLFSIDA